MPSLCCRYNALNQLSCLVCGISIKNELLWTTHLHSKKHKDAVLVLKSSKSSTTSQQPHPHQKEAEFLKPSAPPISKRKTSEVCVHDVQVHAIVYIYILAVGGTLAHVHGIYPQDMSAWYPLVKVVSHTMTPPPKMPACHSPFVSVHRLKEGIHLHRMQRNPNKTCSRLLHQ